MALKSFAAKILAKREVKMIEKWSNNPIQSQHKTFDYLLKMLRKTQFGVDHQANSITSFKGFQKHIPLTDYEGLKEYVTQILEGGKDVLWPGVPLYFCKTSGTTSGAKYIPMSKEGIRAQINAARASLMCYIHETGNASFTDGKMIFLQGSPEMDDEKAGIGIGRLSGIVAHHVPGYLQKNRMPSWQTNCIADWEKKVDAIVEETMQQDMRLISGIPPWVQMYFERLLKRSGKSSIKELFPNFSVFAHGGVNYEPYKATMEKLIGGSVDSIETYPASEGFIAYQDSQHEQGLLLNLDGGIFYEFVPLNEIHNEQPTRLTLDQVELDQNYVIILNTSSGLWGYIIGDTVKFVSTDPYRIVVTGRVKHFISAFGEHVIAEEVESSMTEVCEALNIQIQEFHVAPQVNPSNGLPFHEWFVESNNPVPPAFATALDQKMQLKNSYYKDLITGSVLRPLVVTTVEKGAFNKYMESVGRLGGQNKLPRLSNNREIADSLS